MCMDLFIKIIGEMCVFVTSTPAAERNCVSCDAGCFFFFLMDIQSSSRESAIDVRAHVTV